MPQTPFNPAIDVFAISDYSGNTQVITQNWYITTLTQAKEINQLPVPTGPLPYNTVAPVQTPDGNVYQLAIDQFGSGAPNIVDQPWFPIDGSGASLIFTSVPFATYSLTTNQLLFTCSIVYPSTGSSAQAIIAGLPVAANKNHEITGITVNGILLTPTVVGSTITLTNAQNEMILNSDLSGQTINISGVYQT